MKKESEAVLLRIFIGEDDKYGGKPLYRHLVEMFREAGLAGATVLRGIEGFGKTSHYHTTSILRLSMDMPVVIELVDTREKIDRILPKLEGVVRKGMITEEKVTIIFYEGDEPENR
jgi:PII-like signaling protein